MLSRHQRSQKRRSIVYVRLRRRESANCVVLSSPEKFTLASAVFQPLIEKLAALSSVQFYKHLDRWETLARQELRGGDDTVAEGSEVATADTDRGVGYDFLPDELFDWVHRECRCQHKTVIHTVRIQ